ncbi:tyrosine-type recombinase/integrase [Paenirhodobacter populi]|uniref:tyrosine-type recombinase/integrase n=1 Tax=Paenirhodobacter populi TaxID=2306993 RepID=UPI0036095FB2
MWHDPDGGRRRYKLDASTTAEAEAEARQIFRQAQAARKLTVADVWSAYRSDRDGRRIASHMGDTGKAILPTFGALIPEQIKVQDCRDYTDERRKIGRKDGTIRTELGHLRTCLRWAAENRMIEFAPSIERPAMPAPKDRYLTRAEIDRLLAADCEHHIRLAILLMLTTAARVGAVLELTWDRVDMVRGQINLRVDGLGPRKGRAVVPINGTLRAALTTAKERAMSEYVVEYAGAKIGSIKKGFHTACENAKLKGITPHVLRHTAAVHMVEAGIPIAEVAQFLGHSNPTVTYSTYGRFSPDHLRKAAEVLEFGKVRQVR